MPAPAVVVGAAAARADAAAVATEDGAVAVEAAEAAEAVEGAALIVQGAMCKDRGEAMRVQVGARKKARWQVRRVTQVREQCMPHTLGERVQVTSGE